MNILLDTNIFLWLINDDPRLPHQVKSLYLDEDNDFTLSVASCWEIIIKHQIGKLEIPAPADSFLDDQIKQNELRLLSIKKSHVFKLLALPSIHKDPFDRLIIAAALCENLPVLSSDKTFRQYGLVNLF